MSTTRLIELVIQGLGQVVGKVVVEFPSEPERKQLRAIADSQYRNSPAEGRAEQRAIECDLSLARGLEVHRTRKRARGEKVVAAGKQESVDSLDQRFGLILNREMKRNPARLTD